ncbi:MAG: FAD:protein FMN transferase [Bacteroidetes Order II. Incertae sedis bacterium]|nr:FAD:protein FMN transferase [Bacteroidetes Order II. bacterium]
MQVRIVLFSEDEALAITNARRAFVEIDRLDAIFSDYRVDSELNILVRQAVDSARVVSPELFSVLTRAQEMAAWSGGAFDVTVGPLSQLWRKARRLQTRPPADELEVAKQKTGWRLIKLSPTSGKVQLLRQGLQLDLGGIAKGFIAEAALNALRKAGCPRAMVEIGGEVAIGAPPPDTKGWWVNLPNDTQKPLHLLRGVTVSTSGDTEQFVELNGVRYSHILDPRTGLGLTSRISVTVIASDGALADALSTTLSVLGEQAIPAARKRFKGIQIFFRRATG